MAGKNDCGMAGKVGGKWEEGNGWRETGGGKWVAGNGWREMGGGKWMARKAQFGNVDNFQNKCSSQWKKVPAFQKMHAIFLENMIRNGSCH